MNRIAICILIMVLVTYLPRALPLLFCHKIQSRFVLSFLSYIPYAVLSVMTFPAILDATGDIYSASAGLIVAVVTAYFGRSLLTVAVCSTLAALVVMLVCGI